MSDRPGRAIAAALTAASFYGTVPTLTRAAYEAGIPAAESVIVRTIGFAAIFAAIALLRGLSLNVPRRALPSFIAQAVGTVLVSFGYMASVQFIPVGLAVVIFFTFPVMILIAAPLVEGHAPSVTRIIIAVIAFAGLAVAIGPGFDTLDIRGIALAATAAVGAAIQFFSGRVLSRHLSPGVFASLVHLAILPVIVVIALWTGGGLRLMSGEGVASPAYAWLAGLMIAYAIAYFMHMQALVHAPASLVATLFNLEPVVATAVAALVLGEVLAPQQYVGGVIVLAALVTSSLIGLKRPLRG